VAATGPRGLAHWQVGPGGGVGAGSGRAEMERPPGASATQGVCINLKRRGYLVELTHQLVTSSILSGTLRDSDQY
jgi:hypothetical protein